MKKTSVVSLVAALAVGLSFDAVAGKKDYTVDASTPEKRAALVEKYWASDPKIETTLWPADKIPLKTSDKPVKFLDDRLKESILLVCDVNNPFFRFQRAPGEGEKPVVVVLPGGGYGILAWNLEGLEVADWLNSLGFSAAVLAYRVPGNRDGALCDVQRTIGILRRDAKKYGIDPGRIGVIGFSAGANLTIRTATNWRKRLYARVDDADDFSCRPDFQMPIYPWDIRTRNDPKDPGKKWKDLKIRAEYPVDAETPPSFTVQATDDFCEAETAMTYDYHLRLAGVASTIRLYHEGGHGYGVREYGKPTDAWPHEAAAWLAQFNRGMLGR